MQSIVIVDYGMGNVHSVQKAFEYIAPNAHISLTNDADKIRAADRVVFPGQGAMGACMRALNQYGLVDVIKSCAASKPFLGICLGLQLLFDHSAENGGTQGLSIVAGEVNRFEKSHLKVPHMGWNQAKQTQQHPLWHNIADNARFYSVHSYYVQANDDSIKAATMNYGIEFTSAIATGNIFAVQFHPEKSQHDGLQLLTNFVNWRT